MGYQSVWVRMSLIDEDNRRGTPPAGQGGRRMLPYNGYESFSLLMSNNVNDWCCLVEIDAIANRASKELVGNEKA